MSKRPLTPSYIFFLILFTPDTWQILAGVTLSWILTPRLIDPEMGRFGVGMFGVMLACIGYAVFTVPARHLSRLLRKWVSGLAQK